MKAKISFELVINGLLFQACWFLAIFSDWYWAAVALLCMIAHLGYASHTKWQDLKLLAVVAFSGITVDTLFTVNGIYSFGNDLLLTERSVPIWLCILWSAFALTLNHSLNWLVNKGPWFIIGCAIAGPVSYIAGRSNGVVEFSDQSLILMAFEWALIALLTLYLVNRSAPKKTIGEALC